MYHSDNTFAAAATLARRNSVALRRRELLQLAASADASAETKHQAVTEAAALLPQYQSLNEAYLRQSRRD